MLIILTYQLKLTPSLQLPQIIITNLPLPLPQKAKMQQQWQFVSPQVGTLSLGVSFFLILLVLIVFLEKRHKKSVLSEIW